jgi:hypothetical protein
VQEANQNKCAVQYLCLLIFFKILVLLQALREQVVASCKGENLKIVLMCIVKYQTQADMGMSK